MITYSNFWPGFQGKNSLLEQLISNSVPNHAELDINISSVFTFPSLKDQVLSRAKAQLGITSYEQYRELALYRHPPIRKDADINIWYSGENLRPPSRDYDLAISFDRTDLDREVPNVYLPFWMYNINWNMGPRSDIREYFPTPEELTKPFTRNKPREQFCCAFFNNSEPTRISLLNTLKNIESVDTYGQLFGRPVKAKNDVAREYVFMLTPENSYYPGYITEKVFEARSVGCIPIWWGSNEYNELNPKAMVDATKLNSADLLAQVKKIFSSKQLQEEMLSEPILLSSPKIEPTIESITLALQKLT
jgi:hypothetical protein